MCIISGCDYLDRLPKCGLKTVHKQFRKFSNVDRGIKAFISNHNMKNVGSIDTKNYYDKFIEVRCPSVLLIKFKVVLPVGFIVLMLALDLKSKTFVYTMIHSSNEMSSNHTTDYN